jgi:hypothetical protein
MVLDQMAIFRLDTFEINAVKGAFITVVANLAK